MQVDAHVLDYPKMLQWNDPMHETAASAAWQLDPQLARDTVAIGDLPLSRILLMNDANYPWLLLVPRLPDLLEIIDLDERARAQLMREIARVADALKSSTACDKLNIAAIGNVVAQLHIHVVARFRDDPTWPKPVWGQLPACAYDPSERDRLIGTMRNKLGFD
jgi:diadenosine tetraphosphate (Ap4A) HIT family hydrolase